jgi:hypothetical protein
MPYTDELRTRETIAAKDPLFPARQRGNKARGSLIRRGKAQNPAGATRPVPVILDGLLAYRDAV